jgi:isopenicillin-N epimerase
VTGALAELWPLDPTVVYLNHGSFGACPTPVLDHQRMLRDRLEREPVRFFVDDLEPMMDEVRAALGEVLDADPDDLALVPNATAGVNTVLRSLELAPGDELLVTDHEYNACRNALDFVAEQRSARVRVVTLPLPLSGPDAVLEAVLAQVGPRTRLALLDHVTSPTGIVLPIQRLGEELAARGVDVLVDGAHALGMVDVSIRRLDVAYYTANCHKWLCAPKGSAVLYVRRDRQASVRPLSISHGANASREGRSRFRLEFDWTGTCDPTAHLSVPVAIRFLEGLVPGGLPGLMLRNHEQCVRARRVVRAAVDAEELCPDEMLGSLASVRLADAPSGRTAAGPMDPRHDALFARHRIEVPVFPWPAPPARMLRLSAQAYNVDEDYRRLADALTALLRSDAGQ